MISGQETLEDCPSCDGQPVTGGRGFLCQGCLGTGRVWEERCYSGELSDGEFLYWQARRG